MIEKRIAFFWEGTTMSFMRYMTLYSFCKLNPDWEVILYLSEVSYSSPVKPWIDHNDQDCYNDISFNYFGRIHELPLNIKAWKPSDLFSDVLAPSHRSDIFQWEWLTENSGFYADMDIIFVKPMEDWYNKIKDYDIVIPNTNVKIEIKEEIKEEVKEERKEGEVWIPPRKRIISPSRKAGRKKPSKKTPDGMFSIGFIGSSGNQNDLFSDLYSHCKVHAIAESYQSTGVMVLYKLLNNGGIEEIANKYPQYDTYNMEMDLVYPFGWEKKAARFVECHKELPDITVGIHWYAGEARAQRANRILNSMNIKKHHNTVCYFMNKIWSS